MSIEFHFCEHVDFFNVGQKGCWLFGMFQYDSLQVQVKQKFKCGRGKSLLGKISQSGYVF